MRTLRALTGMPVVCDGKRIGRLVQAELAADLKQLEGIWISAGLRGTRYIPSEELEMLGRVAIVAERPGRKGRMRARGLFMRAVSTDGSRLGAVTGAEVDELSFAVTALELSAGVWDDLARGRRRVTRYTVNRESGEVIIDPDREEEEANADEGWHDEGSADGHADRRLGGDDLRRHELADREEVEPEGQADRQLDL